MGFFKWLSGRPRNIAELLFVHLVGFFGIGYFVVNGAFRGGLGHSIMEGLTMAVLAGAMGGMWYGLYRQYRKLKDDDG